MASFLASLDRLARGKKLVLGQADRRERWRQSRRLAMSRGLRRRRRPYFGVFDPVLLGQSFDPDDATVRRFVPELASLPASVIHQPWSAAPLGLKGASVELGDTRPAPIIDHKTVRARFKPMRGCAGVEKKCFSLTASRIPLSSSHR
jgi:hypothetical protein